jgi:hypothetical protein
VRVQLLLVERALDRHRRPGVRRQQVERADQDVGDREVGGVLASEQPEHQQGQRRGGDEGDGGGPVVLRQEADDAGAAERGPGAGMVAQVGRDGRSEQEEGDRDDEEDRGQHPALEDAVAGPRHHQEGQRGELQEPVGRVLGRHPLRPPERGEGGILEAEGAPEDRREDEAGGEGRLPADGRQVVHELRHDQHERHREGHRGRGAREVGEPEGAAGVAHLRQESRDRVGRVQLADAGERHHGGDQGAVAADVRRGVEPRRDEPEGHAEQRGHDRARHQAVGAPHEGVGEPASGRPEGRLRTGADRRVHNP